MMKVLLMTLVVVAITFVDAQAYQPYVIDPTDLCILTCDRCFKDKHLMKCANHCIDTGGDVGNIWKLICPLFEDTPTVQQV